MFTGLIQTIGRVTSVGKSNLVLEFPSDPEDPVVFGESIAINGCCLTVANQFDSTFGFDLSPETLSRTNLGLLGSGAKVNVERAMRLSSRLGGHIVQGHVDAVGTVSQIINDGDFWKFTFDIPHDLMRYVIQKGSICVNGISLTVVDPNDSQFSVAIIPETFSATTLQDTKIGDQVNIEVDLIAKYVEKLANFRG